MLAEVLQRVLERGVVLAARQPQAFAALARIGGGDRIVRAAGFVAGLGYAVPGTVLAVGAMWLLVAAERGWPLLSWICNINGAINACG